MTYIITFILGTLFGWGLTYNIMKDAEIAKQAESLNYEMKGKRHER